MEIIKVIILGIVQGFTEFLPISSSGHLVLAAEILNYTEEGIAFEVFVHFGTLLSVLIVFRNEIIKMISAPYRVWVRKENDSEIKEFLNWDFYVIIGTLPAAIIGLLFKDEIESLFSSIFLVLIMLTITGSVMFVSQFIKNRNIKLNINRSLLIGIAQACAILPGISRSGSTIVTGMALGIDREKAAKFSFILSIPAILGATVLKVNDLMASQTTNIELMNLIIGTVISCISGYIAILWLLDFVKKGRLQWFGYYCYLIAFFGLVWYAIK